MPPPSAYHAMFRPPQWPAGDSGEETMAQDHIDRRSVLAGSTLLGAASLLPQRALAQAGAPAPGLPARGEFVVRGAHVLTMDPALGELPSGDVHVRNGADRRRRGERCPRPARK